MTAAPAPAWTPLPREQPTGPGERADADARARVAGLVTWARAGGAELGPIAIEVDDRGDRRVIARDAVSAGALLLAVPRALLVTDADMATSPLGAAVRGLTPMLRSGHDAVAVWLVDERGRPDSPWRPYLDALPATRHDLPMYRGAAEVAALAGTRALEVIAEQIAGVRDDHDLLTGALDELSGLSLAALSWGRAVAGSRCFRVADGDGSTRALVPLADMLDHGGRAANAAWAYHAGARRFEIRATRACAAGEALRHSYGRYDNARLVAGHGFAEADNPDDEAALRFATPGGIVTAPVGAVPDRRLDRVISLAHRLTGRAAPDERATAQVIATAARAALAALAAAPAAPAASAAGAAWAHTCRLVRAGERAVLERVLAMAAATAAAPVRG